VITSIGKFYHLFAPWNTTWHSFHPIDPRARAKLTGTVIKVESLFSWLPPNLLLHFLLAMSATDLSSWFHCYVFFQAVFFHTVLAQKLFFFSYTFFQSTSGKPTRGEWEFYTLHAHAIKYFHFSMKLFFPRQRFRYFSDFLFSSFLFSSPCWMFSTTFLPACPWPCSPVLLFCPASFFDFPLRECPAECRLSS